MECQDGLGATGSGKSYVDIAVTIPKRIIAAKGEGLIVLMGNTRGTLERNILEPMRALYPDLISIIRSDNTVTMFGKKVYALGADNKKHVSRIQGATFEYVYGDEVTTWSEEVFQMLKSRLRCEHSHFDGTCNPATPFHWFKGFLDSDADIFQQKYIIEDGVLPEYVVEELKKEYMGTVYYDRYILGEWAQAEGMIYPMYKDALAESPDIPVEQYALSIDYGTKNPFAALLWAKRGRVWYAEREYYYDGRKRNISKTDGEYLEDIERFVEDIDGRIETIVDPSAASFITLLMKKKQRFRVIPAINNVLDGIRETATCMTTGKIKINPTLKNWIMEASGYVWDDNTGEERPVKVADHLMDSTRYLVKTKNIANRIQETYRPIF